MCAGVRDVCVRVACGMWIPFPPPLGAHRAHARCQPTSEATSSSSNSRKSNSRSSPAGKEKAEVAGKLQKQKSKATWVRARRAALRLRVRAIINTEYTRAAGGAFFSLLYILAKHRFLLPAKAKRWRSGENLMATEAGAWSREQELGFGFGCGCGCVPSC